MIVGGLILWYCDVDRVCGLRVSLKVSASAREIRLCWAKKRIHLANGFDRVSPG